MPSEAAADVMLRVSGLSKVYPLYRSPMEHLLDLYGLRHLMRTPVHEHVALEGVSFEVKRGERVAIIGRNGAGKSTLLKIVSGVTNPTAGELEVHAEKMALLQIGTGFHADLSGRQNAAGFARLRGVPAHLVNEAVAETEAFAEIGEYFDQPFSTYSTGMQARVMFAAAVSVEPDLLIIDEVLSVGDAYFAQKCVNRLMEICSRTGATMLLVTHNIYDAQRLCDRMIWLDDGRVRIDDHCIPVMNAYEAAVRSQTEAAKRAQRPAAEEACVLGEIRRVEEAGAGGSCHLAELSFDNGEQQASFTLASHGEVANFEIVDDPEEGNWGAIETVGGRFARAFERHGSLFHTLPFTITGPLASALARSRAPVAQLACLAPQGETLELSLLDQQSRPLARGILEIPAKDGWQEMSAALEDVRGTERLDRGERFGSRRVEIEDFEVCNAAGRPSTRVGIGERVCFSLGYRINDPDLDECPLFAFTVVSNGINVVYLWTDRLRLRGRASREGRIDVVCDPLLLGQGDYNITVSIYRANYLAETKQGTYFAVDDAIYDMRRRTYDLEVTGPQGGLNMRWDFAFQQPSRWSVDGGDGVDGGMTLHRGGDE